jgi:hypothetical protein
MPPCFICAFGRIAAPPNADRYSRNAKNRRSKWQQPKNWQAMQPIKRQSVQNSGPKTDDKCQFSRLTNYAE